MNFYKRFIGDIQRKTGHLSLMQFGAYDRLLDHYYATAQPLPLNLNSCYRIASAITKLEKQAVQFVLAQYFDVSEEGYVQKRVEEMLEEARSRIASSQQNGRKGGRPASKKEKPTGFFSGTQDEPPQNLSQSQSQITTSLRSVVGASQPRNSRRGSALAQDWQLPPDWQAWAEQERPDLDARQVAQQFADYWHAKAGADARKVDWQATWRNWVRNQHAPRAGPAPAETPYQRSQRERMAEVAPRVARAEPGQLPPGHQVIDLNFTTPEPKRLGHA